MKQLIYTLCLLGGMTFASCNDYLDIVPKGNKIPTTLADYEALLRYEYGVGYTPISNALYLLNDYYLSSYYMNSNTLQRANYMWDETADRVDLNNEDEDVYYYSYSGISTCNLIVENVPEATEATDAERAEVIAYAKVVRSMCYFILINYYADTYDSATAANTRGVPLITSADIDAPFEQVSVAEMYDFIITNVEEAIADGLPVESMTPIHPNLGAAYALLARVYLQMQNYEEALRYANLALGQNDQLYDWNAYYDEHRANIENPDDYSNLPTPTDYDYVENYYFRCGNGSPNYTTRELSLPVERAERFEEGDARFMSRWKRYSANQDTYYRGTGYGYFNWGGLTTTEVYLIKAECLARQNDLEGAMDALNTVRETRIRPEVYQPLEASTLADAISLIRRTKDNELIFSIVPFADARRFNHEGTYARTMTKTYNGQTYTLSPTSHLWTMPFPAGAMGNPGNGTLEQNVER